MSRTLPANTIIPQPPSDEKKILDPRMALCRVIYISSYTMDMYEERFFLMNRETIKHSSMVKTVEGTNPCQYARLPCPLLANRCMGIARMHCRGDR